MQTDVEQRLVKIEDKIDSLTSTIDRMANQAEQIAALWKKMDKLQDDNIVIQKFQASCPRVSVQDQINRLWTVIWPVVLVLVGVAFKLFHGGMAK
jgi:hypothetical protein